MSKDTKARDWEFASILSLGASCGFAAGGWVFSFRCKSINYWEDFILLGVGVGTPGTTVEVSLPQLDFSDLSWSTIKCKPKDGFSASQLHLSPGSIGSVGASALGVGYSRLYAEAGYWKSPQTRSERVQEGLFGNTLNDGLGVSGETGLKDAAGQVKKGLNAKLLTAGGVAVLGVWFGIGSVVRDALAAVSVITINVLSMGLVQAGEALLKGRGKSAMYRFAEGFAFSLAEGTADKPNISQSDFQRYKSLDWRYKLKTFAQLYIDNGNDASFALGECETAGKAYGIQCMVDYVSSRGENAWYSLMKEHRTMYGATPEWRKSRYQDLMYDQVDAGKTVGIRLA
ncbi:MAG: hypothetical protein JNL58_02855 [Planctomyces sp.]|nr:hypothetical protein [Planctomyces sp.]